MIDLKECRKHYYDHTGNASAIQRQLAFAGIAIIWLFRIEAKTGAIIPSNLTLSLILFVSAIAADLFHYLLAGCFWGIFSRYKEQKLEDKKAAFEAPRWINWPGNTFFVLKFVCVIAGYYKLLGYLIAKLSS
jgi:hypothetical protein